MKKKATTVETKVNKANKLAKAKQQALDAKAKKEQEKKQSRLVKSLVLKTASGMLRVWVKTDNVLVNAYLDGAKAFAKLEDLAWSKAKEDPKFVNRYHKELKPYLISDDGWTDGYCRKRLSMLREKAKLAKDKGKNAPEAKDKISLTINSETTTILFDSNMVADELCKVFKTLLKTKNGEEILKAMNIAIESIS